MKPNIRYSKYHSHIALITSKYTSATVADIATNPQFQASVKSMKLKSVTNVGTDQRVFTIQRSFKEYWNSWGTSFVKLNADVKQEFSMVVKQHHHSQCDGICFGLSKKSPKGLNGKAALFDRHSIGYFMQGTRGDSLNFGKKGFT